MSLLNGKVLDVPSGNNSNVRMWDSRAGKTNELWYLDENKRIRSYATDACLTSNGNNSYTLLFLLFTIKYSLKTQNESTNSNWTSV